MKTNLSSIISVLIAAVGILCLLSSLSPISASTGTTTKTGGCHTAIQQWALALQHDPDCGMQPFSKLRSVIAHNWDLACSRRKGGRVCLSISMAWLPLMKRACRHLDPTNHTVQFGNTSASLSSQSSKSSALPSSSINTSASLSSQSSKSSALPSSSINTSASLSSQSSKSSALPSSSIGKLRLAEIYWLAQRNVSRLAPCQLKDPSTQRSCEFNVKYVMEGFLSKYSAKFNQTLLESMSPTQRNMTKRALCTSCIQRRFNALLSPNTSQEFPDGEYQVYREDISNIQLNCGIEFFQFSNTSLVHVNSTQLDDDQEKRRKKEKVDCCVPPPVRRVGGSDEEGSLSSAAAAAATATAASTRFIYRMTGILPCLLLSSL